MRSGFLGRGVGREVDGICILVWVGVFSCGGVGWGFFLSVSEVFVWRFWFACFDFGMCRFI